MKKPCKAFKIKDSKKAFQHMKLEKIEEYGDFCCGHVLHTWDDGYRYLAKCRKCGGYVLVQCSECHCFSDSDSYYIDYFPVSSPDEAKKLNEKYDGFQIETNYSKHYLKKTY